MSAIFLHRPEADFDNATIDVRQDGTARAHLVHLADGRVALRLEADKVDEKPWYWASLDGWKSVSEADKKALDAWHDAKFPKE